MIASCIVSSDLSDILNHMGQVLLIVMIFSNPHPYYLINGFITVDQAYLSNILPITNTINERPFRIIIPNPPLPSPLLRVGNSIIPHEI